MIVALDIGNTDIVIGFNQNKWEHVFRVASNPSMEANEYEKKLRIFLLEEEIDISEVDAVIISSVVPDLLPTMQAVIGEFYQGRPLILNGDYMKQLSLGNINPYELGSDLAANAIGAYDRFRQSAIVVDFGTALTFTGIGDEGEILGVSIAPGVKTAMKSLSSNTARLPEIPLEIPNKALGANTIEALQSGIMDGYVGLVTHKLNQIKSEMKGSPKVIATGGLSYAFQPLHELFDEMDVNLTLNGLKVILTASI